MLINHQTMKFLLSLSFLLFAAASSINASSIFAEGPTPPPILDATGAPLQFGVPYNMLPAFSPWRSGGVILGSADPSGNPCLKPIQLSPTSANRGTPVVFSSAVQNVTGNITMGSELIISFYNLTRPNDESCGGSNSTTWVTERMGSLAVGGEALSNVFRLSTPGVVTHSYSLKPVIPLEKQDIVVGVQFRWGTILRVVLSREFKLAFVFQEAKSTEEDEDDKPVIIQMPQKMSV